MGLVDHARRELQAAGLFDADSDYGGMLGHAVVELMEVFSKQGHSGASAMATLALFDRLARFDVLTSITSDSSEWVDVSEMSGEPMWQNNRKPSLFSRDGGRYLKGNGDCNSRPDPWEDWCPNCRLMAAVTNLVDVLPG